MQPSSSIDRQDPESRLSQISTAWTLMYQAHQENQDEAQSARRKLIERYSPAIHRYLLGALRDSDAAADVFQQFALHLIEGKFRKADPEKGRFRHLLKTSLYHLVVDHGRLKKRTPKPLTDDHPEAASDEQGHHESDLQFLAIWRAELLARAWDALARFERENKQPYYQLLRYRTDNPEVRSSDMADHFGPILGRVLTVEWIRKRLHLAREKFTMALLDEVAQTLENPSLENLEEELIDLELHEHCRTALERRRALR